MQCANTYHSYPVRNLLISLEIVGGCTEGPMLAWSMHVVVCHDWWRQRRYIMTNEKAKTNSVVTATWVGTTLTLAVKGAGNIVFDMDKVSPVLIERAAMHGFEQRLRDRAAIGRDTKTGASASPADKFARIKSLADHYATDDATWEMRGEGGVRRKEADYIIEALAQVQGVDVETITARVTAMAEKRAITVDAYLKQVATSPKVAEAIAIIKYGEANPEMADDMLGELEEDDDGEQS